VQCGTAIARKQSDSDFMSNLKKYKGVAIEARSARQRYRTQDLDLKPSLLGIGLDIGIGIDVTPDRHRLLKASCSGTGACKPSSPDHLHRAS
jgi:hypothetical protein